MLPLSTGGLDYKQGVSLLRAYVAVVVVVVVFNTLRQQTTTTTL